MGASAQWCFISGHHLEVTFSNEDGETTEKQMRNTSVWKKSNYMTCILYNKTCLLINFDVSKSFCGQSLCALPRFLKQLIHF